MTHKAYIVPYLHVVTINVQKAMLLTASMDGETIIEGGGGTEEGGVEVADVKRSYNVWDDDWSSNPG